MTSVLVVHYNEKDARFEIACPWHLNELVKAIPDRRWMKTLKIWWAPPLRRNVIHIKDHVNEKFLTPEAKKFLANYVEKTPAKKVDGGFPAWYKFKTDPMPHQTQSIQKGWGMSEFALLLEQGLGKSKCIIDLAAANRMANNIDAMAVICPTSIKFVWGGKGEELDIHCPIPFQSFVLTAGDHKRAMAWINELHDFPILIVGIEALSQGRGAEVLEYFVRTRRTLLAIDESSGIKNFSATCTEKSIDIGKKAVIRIIATGTPITQGLHDFYSQFAFLDEDILGFESFYSFRNHFCIMGGFDDKQIVGFTNAEELLTLVEPYAIRITKDQAMKYLPPKVYQKRYVELTDNQRKLYNELSKGVTEFMGGKVVPKTVLEKVLRLQQIAGGFLGVQIGVKESGQPVYEAQPIPGRNPKLEELLKAFEDVWPTSGGKVVVFAWQRAEIRIIGEALRKQGYKVVEFHGGIEKDQREINKKAFQDGDAEVFLATQQAAQMGLTLTACRTAIYYSNDYSLIKRLQSEDRIHRKGSERHESVTYIDIIARNTVDKRIVECLVAKKDLADMVSDALKSGNIKNFLNGDE